MVRILPGLRLVSSDPVILSLCFFSKGKSRWIKLVLKASDEQRDTHWDSPGNWNFLSATAAPAH